MAAAWFGCQISTDEATSQEAWEAMTPGGQTPRPAPSVCNLGYYEYLPDGYPTGGPFPLIVFFHGAGEKGNGSLAELPEVLKHGPPKLIEGGREFPAIVISPQTSSNWASSVTTPFVDCILNHYDVDRTRVYITGLSLGGGGTWDYARANPGNVAAIVPICGLRSGTGYSVVRGMPVWTFHREGDGVVSIDHTQDILEEITGVRPEVIGRGGQTGYFNGSTWNWRTGQAAPLTGENPTFTVYAGTGHDAWTAAYNNQAMWDWLFAQKRSAPPPSSLVFQQDFQSSTSVSSYENATSPSIGQLNDIGAMANGGTFSINAAVLRVAFDVGVSGWTTTPFQSGAMGLTIGKFDGLLPYDSGGASVGQFHTISVKGQGVGQFSVGTSGIESALLAANGTLHHVDVYLNKSGAAANYRGPDGVVRSLQNNGVALWVNGAAVVTNGAASNGAESALTDFRIRWPHADNGTWVLDNFVMSKALPQ